MKDLVTHPGDRPPDHRPGQPGRPGPRSDARPGKKTAV